MNIAVFSNKLEKNIDNLELFKEIYQMMGEYRIGQIIAFCCLLDVYPNLGKKERGKKKKKELDF